MDNNPNPLHCAKHLGAYFGPRFAEFIQAEFGLNGKKPDQLLFRLCWLPFKHFLTLNFDCSLEQIHGTLNRAYHTTAQPRVAVLLKKRRLRAISAQIAKRLKTGWRRAAALHISGRLFGVGEGDVGPEPDHA